MLELSGFSELCEYVKRHEAEEMIGSVLRYKLVLFGYSDVENKTIEELKEALNTITLEKYRLALGNQIEAQILEIKNYISDYVFLYNEIFKDESSKKTLFNILMYRLTYAGKFIARAYCPNSIQYFDERITRFRDNCVYVDCGGFNGATSVEFVLNCPTYKQIYVYEPIEKFYNECCKTITEFGIKNVTIKKNATYDRETILKFDENIPGSSHVDKNGMVEVKAIRIDDDIHDKIDFIKMDIEGSEQNALAGAALHIRNDYPMMAICVYHTADDLRKIPKMIYELNSDYTFYLRHHTLFTYETVLYAVPNDIGENVGNQKSIQKAYMYLQKEKWSETEQFVDYAAYLMEQYENYFMMSINKEKEFKRLQNWIKELEDAKAFYLKQMNDFKKTDEAKELEITKLRNWAHELEDNKAFLEEQIDNYQENIKNKDKVIAELQGWAQELEHAKRYLEEQFKSLTSECIRLKEQISRIEVDYDNIRNSAQKIEYKYNQLKNDSIIRKIIKFRKYEQ